MAAFWILSTPSFESTFLAGLSLGLFLSSKPSSPGATMVLGLGFAIGAWRADRRIFPLLAAALALALGSESYLTNLASHGNPLWPIRIDLGPMHLPGQSSLSDLLAAGAGAPRLSGSLPSRMLRSWAAVDPLPAFDMRVGGFGPLFLFFALPLGLWGAFRRGGVWAIGLVAALVTADPAIARFTSPFPALLLALSGGELARFGPALRATATTWATALAAVGLWLALPGLTDGLPLRATLGLPIEAQEAALLPSETAGSWAALRRALAPQTSVALDGSFDLTYLLWRPDLKNHVEPLPLDLRGQALLDWIESRDIQLVISGRSSPGHQLALAHPERFAALFRCGASEPDCEVFAVGPTLRELALHPEQGRLPEPAGPKAVDPTP
jgi:hypothetical protein